MDLCDLVSKTRLGLGSPPGAGAARTSPSPAGGGKKAPIWGWRCWGQMQGVWLSWAKLFSPMDSFCFLLCFPLPVAQLSLLWMDLLAWQPGFIAGSPAHPPGHFGCRNKRASSPLFPKMLQTKQEASACPCSHFQVFFCLLLQAFVPFFGPAELSQGYFLPSEVPAGISWKPEMLLGAEKLLALARTARAEHHPSEVLPLGCSQPHPCRGEGSWAAPLELLQQPNTSPIQINLGRKRTWADFHSGKEINPCMFAAISPCPAQSKAALCQPRTCG